MKDVKVVECDGIFVDDSRKYHKIWHYQLAESENDMIIL